MGLEHFIVKNPRSVNKIHQWEISKQKQRQKKWGNILNMP